MNKIEEFQEEVKENIKRMGQDTNFKECTDKWMKLSVPDKYSYNFSWMGRPIIQYPQDIMAMQEIIWAVQPDLIIETGIAHGGSLLFYASMMELLGGNGHVLGIDIDIRKHNRVEIEKHPMYKRVTMFEGSSIDKKILNDVNVFAENYNKVLVVLDSCHTHEHVFEECKAYQGLVKKGSYLVVFDTITEYIADEMIEERPWGKGRNPKTAVDEFKKINNRFEVDVEMENKLGITVAPGGYLKCIK